MDSDLGAYIANQLNKVKYGEVEFVIKRFDNKNVHAVSHHSYKFKPDKDQSDVETAEYILNRIKAYRDSEHRGTVSFSINFKEGSPTLVIENVVESDHLA